MSKIINYKIDKNGVARQTVTFFDMLPKIFVAFLATIIFALAVFDAGRMPKGQIAGGASIDIEQLEIEVKKEELKEQILSRQAVLTNKNKAMIDNFGLLEGKEAKIAELEMAKNTLEHQELDNCLAQIEQGNIDFNCPEQANQKARN